MNFDMKATASMVEGGKSLTPGIHKAKFEGIDVDVFEIKNGPKAGTSSNVMNINLTIDEYGPYSQAFWEPTSNERSAGMYGDNPSQVEQFMVLLRQIFDAVDPTIGEKIDSGEITLSGSFIQIVKAAKKLLLPKVGEEVEIKLIPDNKGYCHIPSFPAKCTKNGALGIQTRVIGHNLTLSSSEVKKIEAAKNAKPTDMATKKEAKELLDDLGMDMKPSNSLDDLPFGDD